MLPAGRAENERTIIGQTKKKTPHRLKLGRTSGECKVKKKGKPGGKTGGEKGE